LLAKDGQLYRECYRGNEGCFHVRHDRLLNEHAN
jgi:hypothetical protein